MLKLLVFLSTLAGVFFIVSSGTATNRNSKETHSSSSSSQSSSSSSSSSASSQSSSSSSSSYANSTSTDFEFEDDEGCPDDVKNESTENTPTTESIQSTSCNGDPNAEPGCGVNCGRHCNNYNVGAVACPAICQLNGCDCKNDYVYDDNINKCVLPQDCTPVCKQNEVYSECINGGCDARNCSQLGQPVPCVKLDPSACIKGCVCKDGYLRANNGTCIPKNQCRYDPRD